MHAVNTDFCTVLYGAIEMTGMPTGFPFMGPVYGGFRRELGALAHLQVMEVTQLAGHTLATSQLIKLILQ